MSLLSIFAGSKVFGSSSSLGREISFHLSSFGVKTVGFSSSICSKTISYEFVGSAFKNLVFKFVDMSLKYIRKITTKFLKS